MLVENSCSTGLLDDNGDIPVMTFVVLGAILALGAILVPVASPVLGTIQVFGQLLV